MTAESKRQAVCGKYDIIIGRNIYNQNLRDYCYTPYKDGKYYSDCSSSISYAYKEAGYGFGILNTAGMYTSYKLTTVDADIADGIPDTSRLRPGDMLLFAGTDASRPEKIGHVEMYCGNGIICGHGSGNPSYKDLVAYCKSRYNSWAIGGWRKGLVCVRRYIQDDVAQQPEPVKKSGWEKDSDGWRFYLGNTGEPVRNSWYLDTDGKWYWFNAAGIMVTNVWYQYNGDWYYMGEDGAMVKGLKYIDGKFYYLDQNGRMATKEITFKPDNNGALQYPGIVA
ncbi:NlpC/P60 family protein [Lacrimispora defluvii]|uniref:Cell wall-binding protein n=1 Tax=Lacrimispora defluvii TaxID=2719233 RepID=A0ABX1VWH3_9FIRM|nr:NlpC/P60 family protein [Lacrimispora defluvii]NNJ32454.1 cell wall-binding protein [Lacrimispora defluvii]